MIKIIAVGKIKDKNLSLLIDDYILKINKYHKTEVIEVKDESINSDINFILNKEATAVLRHIKKNDFVILLDLHGQQIDSISFANYIDKLFIKNSNITFVIGGSLGVGEELIKRANYRLKLSEMTFLHTITRLLILEQIYRCFKILNNETYHK